MQCSKSFVALLMVVAIATVTVTVTGAPTDDQATCTAERADACTRDAMAFKQNNRPVPSTVAEVNDVCE